MRYECIVFFSNVTIALNALLRGLPLDGGEVILSDQEYTSCVNALHFVAERRKERGRLARTRRIPWVSMLFVHPSFSSGRPIR